MTVRIELSVYAPVPVGHRVSIVYLEIRAISLFGGASEWSPMTTPLVCDENTRIVYADMSTALHPESSYEQIRFKIDSVRVSTSQAPTRGTVVSCLALSDHGERVHFRTVLTIETAPALG